MSSTRKPQWAVPILALFTATLLWANNSYGQSKWSVTEIALTATNAYSNPYTQVKVTSVFSGPNGIKKTVQGFWDGDKTWKIRFTPDETGTWSYTTSSVPADPGLTKSGSINASASTNTGFLRRDPSNLYSFKFDNGRRHFMWGQTYYEIVRNVRGGGGWQTSIRNCKGTGFTKIRFLAFPWGADSRYAHSYPFTNTSNHDVLDIAHWRALDQLVGFMNSEGMIADFILFADAPHIYGTQAQDERYTRYIVARYAAYPNVIWCVTNEWNYTNHSQSYWNTIGTIVRQEDPWISEGSALRPLSIHQQTRIDFQYFSASWPVHVIIQYGIRSNLGQGDLWGNKGIVYNRGHNKPVVNDEYGYLASSGAEGRDNLRRASWGVAVGGGYGSTGDQATAGGGPVWCTGEWVSQAYYGDIKRLQAFFTANSIPYMSMAPHNELVSGTRVYCLATTGAQYLVYAAVGGTVKVTLASGTYAVKRYNTRTGESASLPSVAGGTATFTCPDANDWVLHIASSNPTRQVTPDPSSTAIGSSAATGVGVIRCGESKVVALGPDYRGVQLFDMAGRQVWEYRRDAHERTDVRLPGRLVKSGTLLRARFVRW